VFFVLYAMCMLVFLNKLVMLRVSVPMYVNVANFCFCGVSGVLLLFFIFLYRSGKKTYTLTTYTQTFTTLSSTP
jgi:hypothetical protein